MMARISPWNILSMKTGHQLVSAFSLSVVSGLSFNYIDFWRKNALYEIAANSLTENYFNCLYQKNDNTCFDLVKFYEIKLENNNVMNWKY